MSLNTRSPIPLYRQLASRLSADIDAGTYQVAQKIPSENELAQQFDIGRPTVRQATDLLVRQGRLERRRGSGTFVKSVAPAIDLLSLAGTSAAFNNSDLNATLELLSGATKNTDNTYCVQRRASVDSAPVLIEPLHFDADQFPGLDKHNLENRSLSTLVKDAYFLEPSSADQTFSVVLANKSQAQLLDVSTGTPLLKVHRTVHFEDNRNALHTEIVCRTDRFDFSQTLYPTAINESRLP